MPNPQPADEPRTAKTDAIEAEGPISTRAELEQVEERLAIGANIVYETIRREGDDELGRSPQALAWSGFAPGLARFGYCLGFLMSSSAASSSSPKIR